MLVMPEVIREFKIDKGKCIAILLFRHGIKEIVPPYHLHLPFAWSCFAGGPLERDVSSWDRGLKRLSCLSIFI